ncbi:hypothetical protein BDZ94DRAFT_1278467 [Collybia nuda]|uniref:Uncharacterized protein n=1 Tax=Collybia nuda TaxID=64659 RepID=A0A9P6C7M2_9AGAR|nr:hypothetical protein BDZ94DRAFT_1278467 [Collybia nuda]
MAMSRGFSPLAPHRWPGLFFECGCYLPLTFIKAGQLSNCGILKEGVDICIAIGAVCSILSGIASVAHGQSEFYNY